MKRMLINATQAEERRMAVVDGQKLLDFEIEIEGREQRKGNIYKAVVTRVEPSLEACFVDYGEDRHGFLPLKEINKIYFSSNVAPSQAKIQEVIQEGQELLVQVDKEERGNKGAALTTNISLAGRYIVLMPHNQRGGGVSRRIEGEDRAELKEALDQLEYPKGMSVIARTAGIGRDAQDLQWDLNYLLKLWQAIDDAAKGINKDSKEKLIYQEGSLVIRTIRDYFNHDIGDILIDTKDIYEQAKGFMSYVMPEYADRVKLYTDDTALFSRFQIEHQIESAYSRTVQLPSGGAIVIDQTEALVAVDVNSARSIKGSHIEDTATRTNMEAAEEVARQMRLRDLGGLIVIDFIDMEDAKNRRDVENRLRDALRQDRARVQFSTISKFGLLEMSRQRLRPALNEGASIPCPRCGGSGHIRDTESSALQILRVIQEESIKDATAAIHVQVPVEVASFLLNEKRNEITKIELQQRIDVLMIPNKQLETPNYRLERLKQDDNRLEGLVSSYKLAQEVDDPTDISRKPRERTNKQDPIIKGIVHDSVAPQRASQEANKPNANSRHASSDKRVAAPASDTASSTGLFAWVRKIFAKSPDNAASPSGTSQAARVPGKNDSTSAASQNDSARRGSRNDRNRQNREARNGDEGRRSNASADTSQGPKAKAGPRGNSQGERGSQTDAARAPKSDLQVKETNDLKPTNNRRGRGGRDNLSIATDKTETNAHRSTGSEEPNQSVRVDRNSRGGRNAPRNQAIQADAALPAETQQTSGVIAAQAVDFASVSDVNMGVTPSTEDTQDKPVKRERKTRDRYGRDRRERATNVEQNQEGMTESNANNSPAQAQSPANTSVNTSDEALAGSSAQASKEHEAAPPSPAENETAYTENKAESKAGSKVDSAAKNTTKPVVAFSLPVPELESIAASSGLQWVNSNPERIQEVQSAIAAEPAPKRTPRQRPAPVVITEQPLVLVETKSNLDDVDLPFKKQSAVESGDIA